MSSSLTSRQERIDVAISEYLQSVEQGQPVDRSEFLARYPDLTADLEAFLLAEDEARHMVRDALEPSPIDPGMEATPTRIEGRGYGPRLPFLARGARVGDYELIEQIAHGGMGVVYKARQASLNRVVALKMVLAGGHASSADLRRFRTEAEAAALLDHPNIVPIYEIGEFDGLPFFSMKFIEGKTLSDHVQRLVHRPRMSAQLVQTLARALQYAHDRGVIHRDLKPGNILMQPVGDAFVPYIADFGLARLLGDQAGLTQTGDLLGTPSYMAPEQTSGHKNISTSVDIYGLGAILYHLLTGRKPFSADTPAATLLQVQLQDPDRPRSHNTAVDRDLETICLKCLEKDPSRRYLSAAALAEDLGCWLSGQAIAARPSTSWEHVWKWVRRRPAVAGLSGLVVAVTIVALILVTWQWRLAVEARRDAESLARSEREAREAEARRLRESQFSNYANLLMLAEREWSSSQFGAAEAVLERCQTDWRHWEWGHVCRLCRGELVSFPANPDVAFNIVFSPEERFIVTMGEKSRVWDTETREEIQLLPSHDVQFSPRDLFLMYRVDDSMHIRAPRSKTDACVLKGGSGIFSPDALLFAHVLADRVDLIRCADGTKSQTLEEARGPIHEIAFGPKAGQITGIDNTKTRRVWDVKTGKLLHSEAVPRAAAPDDEHQVSPDGEWFIVAKDKKLSVLDRATGKLKCA